jgi:hypothetical protein
MWRRVRLGIGWLEFERKQRRFIDALGWRVDVRLFRVVCGRPKQAALLANSEQNVDG